MPIVKIKLKKYIDTSYKIFIQKECIKEIPSFLKKENLANRYAIITDTKMQKLSGNAFLKMLKGKGIKADIIAFSPGEKSKRLETVEKLAGKMVEKGFTKKTAIIALGGGVVGDLAGFLASVYFRGIPYIHVPTSLMAMVDSAIGGKTGVDLTSGKNLIGTIVQPRAVFIDLNYVKTLPDNQIRNGLAEVIKYGIVFDKKLFKFIEHNMEKILKKEDKPIEFIIKRSVQDKMKIVQRDEHDNNDRMILNYGHTYGHALERMSGYTLLHGFAISIGMVIVNKLAVKKGYLKEKHATRIINLLKAASLPTTTIKNPTFSDLEADKKRVGKSINFILPTKIGKAIIHNEKCLK